MPPPEEALKAIIAAQNGAAPPDSGAPPSKNDEAGVTSMGQPASFDGILSLMESRKRADLMYEMERFMRPGEVRFGFLSVQMERGASQNLIANVQRFLNDETGADWQIEQIRSQEETVIERKERERQERIADAMHDDFLSELIKRIPGSEVLDVVTPPEAEEGEEKIVHLDFSSPQQTRKESR